MLDVLSVQKHYFKPASSPRLSMNHGTLVPCIRTGNMMPSSPNVPFSGELDCFFWKTGHIYTKAFLVAILFFPIDQNSKEKLST